MTHTKHLCQHLWFWSLHYGYDGNKPDPFTGADMVESFMDAVREVGGIAIAPDVTGGDWTYSNNERNAVWLVKSAMNTYNIDANQVYVMGFSMGGEGAWHIGGRHQDLFTGVIPVAAPVTGTTLWKIPVYAIHSSRDEVVSYSAAKRHAESIAAAGGKIEFDSIDDLTHFETGAYSSYAAKGVRWLRQRRR